MVGQTNRMIVVLWFPPRCAENHRLVRVWVLVNQPKALGRRVPFRLLERSNRFRLSHVLYAAVQGSFLKTNSLYDNRNISGQSLT